MIRFTFLLAAILFAMPPFAHAAVLYLDPGEGTYGLGDTFVVAVRLNTEGECINALHVTLVYPKESLRAVDFSRGASIISLWVDEPKIDTDTGSVTFSGGIPGGYCGRIQGDPSLSNILGKVVFTVTHTDPHEAVVRIADVSVLYANDGLGTKLVPTRHAAAFTLTEEQQLSENAWLKEVQADTTPPDAFTVLVESTRDVYDGKYYVVFSTVDKQSGIDHFEIYERGTWKQITSPYELWDQTLRSGVQVRAIDKAGNERVGDYTEGSAPVRQSSAISFNRVVLGVGIVVLVGSAWVLMRRRKPEIPIEPVS